MIRSAEPPTTTRALARLVNLGRAAGRTLLDLVLPPVCLACRAPVATPHSLCTGCWSGLRFIERPYCERLGIPFGYDLGPGALSAEAIADPPPFDKARAAVLYEGLARDMVHRLKYQDRTEVARFVGRVTAHAGRDILASADLVVPVPLHRRRLVSRRFNQSQLIADEIGRVAGVTVDGLALERIKATEAQVGLSGPQRADNVRGAFRVPPAAKAHIDGRRVVLVDDVFTTGATVKAATRALKRGGAAGVDVLTFARVAQGGSLHV